MLTQCQVPYEVDVGSTQRVVTLTRQVVDRGGRVSSAGAVGAAHLAGVIAAETTHPSELAAKVDAEVLQRRLQGS